MVYKHRENGREIDGNAARDEVKDVGENQVLGPDGQFYPKHTKTISGMRPTAVNNARNEVDPVVEVDGSVEVMEGQVEDVLRTEAIQTRSDVIRMFDDTRDEIPTRPDLGSLMDQARLYDQARKELFEADTVNAGEDDSGDLTRLVSEAELTALRALNVVEITSVDPKTRWLPTAAGTIVKALDRNRKPGDVPWWISNSSVVRMWGQLNCGFQVFEDLQLIRDLVDVLGKEWIKPEAAQVGGEMITFVYMTQHVDGLKIEIRQKYPQLANVFDAIVRKQNKEE